MPTTTKVRPTSADDAIRLALEEALREAGFDPLAYQLLDERLEDAVLEALWSDDMTLQQAARSTVTRYEKRLVGEGMQRWNV